MSSNKSIPITHPPPYLPTMDCHFQQTSIEERNDHFISSPVNHKYRPGYPVKFFPLSAPPAISIVAETYDL